MQNLEYKQAACLFAPYLFPMILAYKVQKNGNVKLILPASGRSGRKEVLLTRKNGGYYLENCPDKITKPEELKQALQALIKTYPEIQKMQNA